MPITVYGNTCKTRETYENDKFSIIENTDGTVSVYDAGLNPLTIHETKPCCELLGYTFDTNTQKCKWSLDNEELFKVVLNPEGNSSTLFEVEPNETCSLEVSFDYMFQFDCDNLVKTRADANGVSVSVQNEIDAIETDLNNVTIECERYAALIQAESLIPYVIECYETTLDNYCLTSTGVTEFKAIITSGATGAAGATNWESSGGAVTTMYGCGEVNILINTEPTPGLWITESCNHTIFDKKISNDKLVGINLKYSDCQARQLQLTTELGLKNSGTTTTDVCTEYIDMFEDFETAFTIEIETTGTTRLTSVYEEELLNIGTGNFYDYINTTSGQTGIMISGATTGLMPTLAETTLFSATTADVCTQVRDNLVSDLFNQYLITNELPQTQQERIDIFTELTGWYQGCWLQHKTLITDPTLIGLLENEKINITISIKNCCVDFSILLDRIKMNKVCTKIDNVKRFISEPPKFELTKVCDNKKSWIANTAADERFFDLKYRGTEYDTNHHKLVINTKEVDLNLSPSRAVEQDVWCYIGDNNCILEGCLSSGETFNAFSCPTGYTKDIDGDSCTQLTVTGVTSSATTYTVGSGVTLTRNIHYLSRGTIFVEDITDSQWPIFWSGTSKDSWVGPYYNTDYLTDSSGKFLNHSGFGSNKFTDGSLQYSSPAAFSGIKSVFGKNSADIVSAKLNPNILWGGTDGIVSGSSFVNVSGTLDAGRLLNASVWSNPGTLPVEEWIGLSYCLDLNETKTYRIGFAADDNVRLKVNGEYLINPVTTPDFDPNIHDNFSLSYSRSIQTYVVMGLTLSAGKNIIEVEGINAVSGIAGFVCELYDATEAQLKNIRYESELASVRIFSTADRIGTTFDLGEKSGNSCPVGYSYDNCGPIQCTKIEKVTRDNEQLDEYCPCPDFPLIVKDYENVTLELPLTASTTPFTCNNIFTLTKSYGSTTTLEPIESVKGGDVYAIGVKASTTFNGFWITEENDGSIGVYEATWFSGGTACSCPVGYTATTGNNACQSITNTPATFNGSSPIVSAGSTDSTFGDFGTFFYPEVTSLPNLPLTRDFGTASRNLEDQVGTMIPPTLIINNTYPPFISNSFWDAFDATTGRLNNVGVTTTETEWRGFSYCIDVPVGKVYYIGLGSRWFFRATIDGNVIIDVAPPDNVTTNARAWHIIPYYLTPGKHIIEMEGQGKTSFLPTVFGAEIYDPTSYAALTAATNTTEAGVIFSTANEVGNTFDLGGTIGYSCPATYALNTCGGSPTCSLIANTSITCVPNLSTYENVTDQVDEACCLVIDKAFYTYADMFDQGINTYPSANWDFNLKKCVYTKCGDNGCINLDDVLTTELSQIDTVKEFASVISSELIDVKNRQTLSSYPTLRMLYDRYNSRSVEFCGIDSSKYDYSDMDTFGQTVGNYWIDLIEQVVPATTIWGSTYAYKNTVFDQQKFNYKRGNLYLCDIPPIQLEPFDFLILEYKWDLLLGGNDLDTRTALNGTGDPYLGSNMPMGPDGNYVGYGRTNYVGTSSTTPYMRWGGDCVGCPSSSEQILIDFKKLSTDYTSSTEFSASINALWWSGKLNGDVEINMTTYAGGTMSPDGLGFKNVGGKVINRISFPTNVTDTNNIALNNGDLLGEIKYDVSGKTATLTKATGSPATIPAPKPGPTGTTIMNPPVLASDATVGVCSEVLPNPIVPTTTTGTTVGQITIQPSITKCNGVWIKDDGCESDFLGTVTVMDRLGKIIPT